eukprot:1173281-Prorocentrum_minimum.AAC.2
MPCRETLRMLWFSESATNTLPSLSTATPLGSLNRAVAPSPSRCSASPVPATVDTMPCGETLRILWFNASATKMLPSPSTATSLGSLNRAVAPSPSRCPSSPVPA